MSVFSRQIKIVLGIAAAVVLCWLSAPLWGGAGAAPLPVPQVSLQFNAERAFRAAQEFVTQNPRRVLGSIEARQATGYLQDSLVRTGYQVAFSHFEAFVAGRRQVGRNVVGYKAGTLPGIIALVAHYDMSPPTVQGAMDNGAGVGVMLEMARILAISPPRHGLLILASDGEEWGMLGAADFVANYPERRRIAAALSLDGVSVGELAAFRLDAEGQINGYAPSWLRRIAFEAASTQGLTVIAPAGPREILERALALSDSDQGPFLNAGIPAINLGSFSVDAAWARAVNHSPKDTIENMSPASIAKYGAAAERMVRAIDELPDVAAVMDDAFSWQDGRFVAAPAMKILHYLTFLPFLAALFFGWQRYRQSLSAERILREVVFFLAWLAPFVLTYSMLLFCRLMRLIPRYSRYPGPAEDPALASPAWGVLAVVGVVALLVWIGLHFLARYVTRGLPLRSYGAAKMTLMLFLLIVVMIALQYSSYWAVTFLAFPALIWSVSGRSQDAALRLTGAFSIPAAGFVLYVVAVHSAVSLRMGGNCVWYAILGLSNGMLQWQGYFLAACTFVIGLRLMSLQLSNPAD